MEHIKSREADFGGPLIRLREEVGLDSTGCLLLLVLLLILLPLRLPPCWTVRRREAVGDTIDIGKKTKSISSSRP
jgi:hypothetical protein